MTKKDYGAANKVSRRKRIGIIKPPENPLSSHFTAKIPLTYKSGFPILTSNEIKFLSKKGRIENRLRMKITSFFSKKGIPWKTRMELNEDRIFY
jgi:hypothetical protein